MEIVEAATIDEARQKQAREYGRIRRWLSYLDLAIGTLGILLILVTGLDREIRNVLAVMPLLDWQPRLGWFPLQILGYFLVLLLGYQLVTAAISYYAGFVLPHRYKLSTLSFKNWLLDLFKGLALSIVFEALVLELIFASLSYQPQWWWLWVAAILLFFSVIMANLAPVLIFPLFYRFTPLPEGELTQRLLALVERANTRVRGVFTIHLSEKTTAANAALMGLGNTRRIVLGDTMTDRYTIDEIEVVLAHELGHHVHRDIWKLLVSQSVLTLLGLYVANGLLHWVVDTQHYISLTDAALLPFLFLLMGLFGLIVMPVSNTYSRSIEYQADEYALQATRKIDAFKSAMTRLANQNLSEIEPSPMVEALFHSHPSVRKRLQHADEFAARASS